MRRLYILASLLASMAITTFGQGKPQTIPTSAKTRSFGPALSFRYAAARATPCVTHITALFQQQMSAEDRAIPTELFGEKFFREFFAPLDPHGGAASAGLQTGDAIVRINDDPVASATRFRELMARYRPGDKMLVAFLRFGREFRLIIPLRDRSNTGDVIHGWQ